MDIQGTIGQKIRAARKAARATDGSPITQQRLADRLGMSVTTIKRYESGQTMPTFSTLERIAKELNIPLATIVAPTAYPISNGDFVSVRLTPDELVFYSELWFEFVDGLTESQVHTLHLMADAMRKDNSKQASK